MLAFNNSILDINTSVSRINVFEPSLYQIADEWNNNVAMRATELEQEIDDTYSDVLVPTFEDAICQLATPGSKILDLGCGLGYLADVVQKRGYMVTGIDIAEKAIEYGKLTFPDVKFETNSIIGFSEANVEVFDICVLNMVLHNLVNIQANLDAVQRLIKNRGYVVASIPNPQLWFSKHIKDQNIEFEYESCQTYKVPFRIRHGEPHPSLITYIHRPIFLYKKMIKNAGFNIIQSESPKLYTGQKDDDLMFCVWQKKE
jgi:2-polyprenyl-3-methyl-5-hydroxy-6-metoxy-1,4-benzoquinol methylase